MKIRNGFVTNSSSSSFIIAKNNKCTKEEIKEKLLSMEKQIEEILYDYDSDCSKEEFIEEMARKLFDIPSDLILGEWTVYTEVYGNDYDEYDGFMYGYGHEIDTDNFKAKESGW